METLTSTTMFLFIGLVLSWLYIYTLHNPTKYNVCINQGPYTPIQNHELPPPTSVAPRASATTTTKDVVHRDMSVDQDPLYPPLNRPNQNQLVSFVNEPRIRSQSSYGNPDRYRLVGYIVSTHDNTDAWKLYALQVDRSRYLFYALSANKNLDLKIDLDPSLVKGSDYNGQHLRDIYDLPEVMTISHPMFKQNPYQCIPLKDASSGHISNDYF